MIKRTKEKQVIVVSWGCPRSGTTWLQRLLEQGEGYYALSLREHSPLHPCNSDNGLIALFETFSRQEEIIFVRIFRDRDDIVKSFAHTRTFANDNFPNDPDQVKRYMHSEYYNTIKQDHYRTGIVEYKSPDEIKRIVTRRLSIIHFNYNKLHEEHYATGQIALLSGYLPDKVNNRKRLISFWQETFNKIPVRRGILSDNPDRKKQ